MSFALLLLFAQVPDVSDEFITTRLIADRPDVQHALRDADGDSDLDLFEFHPLGVRLRPLQASGRFADEPTANFSWPSSTVAWDLADLDGDGRVEVLVLQPDDGVRSFELDEQGSFGDATLILEAELWLPPGNSRVDFARDIDGDGRDDLVLPAARSHRIFLAEKGGSFQTPIAIDYDAGVSLSMGNPARLSSNFGRSVSIPWFRLQDVDGDGRTDLVSETNSRIDFHLADEGLSSEPTWTLDLAKLKRELPNSDGIDFDDLMSNIPDMVEWRVADVDGVAPNELILTVGSKLRVFTGGSRTGPDETPDQILNLSGQLLGLFLRDVQGDERPELQLIRGERVSLGRALRYLILPGRIDFDVFTYANQGGVFARRPTQRGTFGVEIPRLLSFMDEAEEYGEMLEGQFDVPTSRFDFETDGRADDVIDLLDGNLVVTTGCAPETIALEGLISEEPDMSEMFAAVVLEELDARGDGGEYVIDIESLHEYDFSPNATLRSSTSKGTVASSTPFSSLHDAQLRVVDLDGDGRDDVVLWGHATDEEEAWTMGFFVRKR